MGTEYSRIGRTRDIHSIEKTFTLVVPTERLIKANRLLALFTVMLQISLLVLKIFQSFASLTCEIFFDA